MSCSKDETPLTSSETDSGTPWYISIFIIVNSILGTGMLNIPLAFHESGGIITSVAFQLVIVIILICTMIGFVRCAHLFNSASYQDVIMSFCGRKTSYFCSILLLLYTFGITVVILIVIGNHIQMFLHAACPQLLIDAPWYVDRKFLLSIVSIGTVLPLCYSKRIDFLKYPSSLGFVAVIYCVLMVVTKYFTGVDGALVGPTRTRPDGDLNTFLAIPTICFSYQGHLIIVPIFSCTKNRENKCFDKAVILSLIICFVIYNSFGLFSYLTFGSAVQSNILMSYKPTPDVLCGVAAIVIKVVVSYPLLQFVGRNVVENLITKFNKTDKKQDPETVDRQERLRRITIATIWFSLTLAISLFVPEIDKVISYLGVLAVVFAFIFPGLTMMEYRLIMKSSNKCFQWSGLLVTVAFTAFGGFIFGMVTTTHILKFIL